MGIYLFYHISLFDSFFILADFFPYSTACIWEWLLKKKKNFQNFTNLLLYDVHFSNGFSASFFLAQGLPTVWSGLGRQIDIQMCAWLLPGPARGRALQKDPGVTGGCWTFLLFAPCLPLYDSRRLNLKAADFWQGEISGTRNPREREAFGLKLPPMVTSQMCGCTPLFTCFKV